MLQDQYASGCHFHIRYPYKKEMLPDDGKICEREDPPWRASKYGHRILCHIPIEELEKMESVIHGVAS